MPSIKRTFTLTITVTGDVIPNDEALENAARVAAFAVQEDLDERFSFWDPAIEVDICEGAPIEDGKSLLVAIRPFSPTCKTVNLKK